MNGVFNSRYNKYLSDKGRIIESNAFDSEVYNFVSKRIENEPQGDSFFVLSIQDVIEKHRKWVDHLSRVRPFYSVKANFDPVLLRVLAKLNVGFEIVSEGELIDVAQYTTQAKSDILFANPIKTQNQLAVAQNYGVDLMTFDNKDELLRIAKRYPTARLIIRIRVEETACIQSFKDKYGCPIEEVGTLLRLARKLNLNVVGVSFHVGCRASDPKAFEEAIKLSHQVFKTANAVAAYNFQILDIGGGFTGAEWHADSINGIKDVFPDIAASINQALENYFPMELYPNIAVIAEPGTYFCASAFSLAVRITGKRVEKTTSKDGTKGSYVHYYINDGVFGSFFGPLYGFPVGKMPLPICPIISDLRASFPSTIWGQTLASLDVVFKGINFPELHIDEWLLIKDMGDYSLSMVTPFCGFEPKKKVHYLNAGNLM